jgi:pyruvate kinase
MLSAETATGDYPVNSVRTMHNTILDAQSQYRSLSSRERELSARTADYESLLRLAGQPISGYNQDGTYGYDDNLNNSGINGGLNGDAGYDANGNGSGYDGISNSGEAKSDAILSAYCDQNNLSTEEIIVRHAVNMANDAGCALILAATQSG